MKYRVEIATSAVAEADTTYEALAAHSSEAAGKWLDALKHLVASLETMPRRRGYARERGSDCYETRQFSNTPYRVLSTIVGDTVRVLHVRHCAMDNIPT